jgi:hypothetical protein
MSSISTIINNTTSFSVRSDESLAAAEQCFTQQGIYGMTGTEQNEEQGWWGPDWDGSGQVSVVAQDRRPYGDLQRLGYWERHDLAEKINRASAARRADFLNGLNLADAVATYDGVKTRRTVVDYEYSTALFIPPWKCFDYPTVSKAPSFVPYADQIEVTVHWKAIDELKAALLLGRGQADRPGLYWLWVAVLCPALHRTDLCRS